MSFPVDWLTPSRVVLNGMAAMEGSLPDLRAFRCSLAESAQELLLDVMCHCSTSPQTLLC